MQCDGRRYETRHLSQVDWTEKWVLFQNDFFRTKLFKLTFFKTTSRPQSQTRPSTSFS